MKSYLVWLLLFSNINASDALPSPDHDGTKQKPSLICIGTGPAYFQCLKLKNALDKVIECQDACAEAFYLNGPRPRYSPQVASKMYYTCMQNCKAVFKVEKLQAKTGNNDKSSTSKWSPYD